MPLSVDPASVHWAVPSEGRVPIGTLVLLHGYGSNERELASQMASLVPDMAVASVRAPIAEGPGYAWVSLQQSLTELDREAVVARADEAAASVLGWLTAARLTEPVGMLGVSQGAVLALHLLRTAPQRIAYAINLAGYVLPADHLADSDLQKMRPPVFWGRGTHDDVIPEAEIRRTTEWLPQHSTLTALTYDSGHEPTPRAFEDAAHFIRQARRA